MRLVELVPSLLLLNVAVDHLLFLAWSFWAVWNFWRSFRRGENGLTTGLLIFFLALALTWLWSIAIVIITYLELDDEYEVITVLFRSWTMNLLIVAAAYLTYQIQKVRHSGKVNY